MLPSSEMLIKSSFELYPKDFRGTPNVDLVDPSKWEHPWWYILQSENIPDDILWALASGSSTNSFYNIFLYMCIIWLLVSCSDFLPSCLHNGCICWNIQCGEQNVISRLYIARMCKTWLAHICGELFSQIWCIRRWFWLSWLAPSPTRAFSVVTDKFSIAFPLG